MATLPVQDDVIVFFGSTIKTRMTVVRLPPKEPEESKVESSAAAGSGSNATAELLIHSPTPLSPDLRAAVDKLGVVAHIVSPNKIHNMAMPEWAKAYPDASVFASPGLQERRTDIRFDKTLTSTPERAWEHVLDQVRTWISRATSVPRACKSHTCVLACQTLTAGNFFFSEVLFFHKPTKTLIVCDMIENTQDESMGCCMGCLLRCCLVHSMGKHKNFASPEHRWYSHDGKAGTMYLLLLTPLETHSSLDPHDAHVAVEATRNRVLAWDFERVVMSHGRIILQEAREIVDEVFDTWIREIRGCSFSHVCRCIMRCCAASQ